ncbi:MAG: hypothetical protein QOK04_1002 [Solirubrobacteraceae bacterium]|nr:hypothetical protein [Solirubrobacteraceae bacterium]
MDSRDAVLGIVLVTILLFAALTIDVIATNGLGVLEFVSLVVLALFALGVVGALRNPPDK